MKYNLKHILKKRITEFRMRACSERMKYLDRAKRVKFIKIRVQFE